MASMNKITITAENVTTPDRLARLDLNKVAALHEGGTEGELRELAEYLGVPADTLIARAEYFRSVRVSPPIMVASTLWVRLS